MIIIEDNSIGTTSGNLVLNPSGFGEVRVTRHPISPFGVTSKGYVDARISGSLSVKEACKYLLRSLPNYSVSGIGIGKTIHGAGQLIVDDTLIAVHTRILFAPSESHHQVHAGIYNVIENENNRWMLMRAIDADTSEKIKGTFVFITHGNEFKNYSFSLVTFGIINIDITPLVFTYFSNAGSFMVADSLPTDGGLLSRIDNGVFYLKNLISSNSINIVSHENAIEFAINNAAIDHEMLKNNNVGDPHGMYLFTNGRANGQKIYGGANESDCLEIYSTRHETPSINSNVQFKNENSATVTNASAIFSGGILVKKNAIFLGTVNTPSIITSGANVSVLKVTESIDANNCIIRGETIFTSEKESRNENDGAVILYGGMSIKKTLNVQNIVSANSTINSCEIVTARVNNLNASNLIGNNLTINNCAINDATIGAATIGTISGLTGIISNELSISCRESIFTGSVSAVSMRAASCQLRDTLVIGNTTIASTGIITNGEFSIKNLLIEDSSIRINEILTNSLRCASGENLLQIMHENVLFSGKCTIPEINGVESFIGTNGEFVSLRAETINGLTNINSAALAVNASTSFSGANNSFSGDVMCAKTLSCNQVNANNLVLNGVAITSANSIISFNSFNCNTAAIKNLTIETLSAIENLFIGNTIRSNSIITSNIRCNSFASSNGLIVTPSIFRITSNSSGALDVTGGIRAANAMITNRVTASECYAQRLFASEINDNSNLGLLQINHNNVSINNAIINCANVNELNSNKLTVSEISIGNGTINYNTEKLAISAQKISMLTTDVTIQGNCTIADSLVVNAINSQLVIAGRIDAIQIDVSEIVPIGPSLHIAGDVDANNGTFASCIITGALNVPTIYGNNAFIQSINNSQGVTINGTSFNNSNIFTGTINANSILTNEVSSNNSLLINANNITFNGQTRFTSDTIFENAITGNDIFANSITGNTINCNNLVTGQIIFDNLVSNNSTFNFAKSIIGTNGIFSQSLQCNNIIGTDGTFSGEIIANKIRTNKLCGNSSLILLGRPEEFLQGSVIIDEVTPSINYATGALVVAGGVGIAGELYVQEKVHVPQIEINNTTIASANGMINITNSGIMRNHGANTITVSLKTTSTLAPFECSNGIITIARNELIIDGTIVTNEDLLFIDNTSGVSNNYYGIYEPSWIDGHWRLQKAECANNQNKFYRGTLIFVKNGETMSGTIFSNTTIGAIQSFALLFSRNGVITTATNIGAGAGIYSHKETSSLNFKSILAKDAIEVINDANEIIIGINESLIDHSKLANRNVGDPHEIYMRLDNSRGRQEIQSNVHFSKGISVAALDVNNLSTLTGTFTNGVAIGGKIKSAVINENIIIEPFGNGEIIGNHLPRSDNALVTKKYLDSVIVNYNNFHYVTSTDEGTTNSISFIEKCKLQIPASTVQKTMIITVSYSWAYSQASRYFNARVVHSDNGVIYTHKESPTRGDLTERRNFSATIPIITPAAPDGSWIAVEYSSSALTDISSISQVSVIINNY